MCTAWYNHVQKGLKAVFVVCQFCYTICKICVAYALFSTQFLNTIYHLPLWLTLRIASLWLINAVCMPKLKCNRLHNYELVFTSFVYNMYLNAIVSHLAARMQHVILSM